MLTVDPFPYQDKAIDMGLDRGNLLIAYGMGLGKTLIQMGICEELLGEDEATLNAIVVPSSLKWQWAQSLVWGTDVRSRTLKVKGRKIEVPLQTQCVVIDGTVKKRDEQYRYIYEHRPDYVILGYENVVNDWRMVKRMKPDLIALDEATAIKSFSAQRSQQVKLWWAPYRYALTGTPIDNRADELFSIMEWVDPDALGRADLFDKAYVSRDGYGRVKRYKNLDVLHEKTRSFMVRKTRFDLDVAPHMPKDFHKDFYCGVSAKTKALYSQVSKELVEALGEIVGVGSFDVGAYYSGERSSNGSEAQGNAMARYSALAMLVDHPMLLLESAKKFDKVMKSDKENPKFEGSKYAWELYLDGHLDWINEKATSPKFDLVMEHIRNVLDERKENKLILFSFSKMMLRLFKDVLGDTAVIFDGDMNIAEKEEAKISFKQDPDVRVFLSSDAGGMGVDLPEANYLINYNHPWSAGKADQRNSRHIRAGSLWDEVWVLNFIVEGSVEEWKYSILDLKRRLGSAIIDGVNVDRGEISFDVESLMDFVSSHTVSV